MSTADEGREKIAITLAALGLIKEASDVAGKIRTVSLHDARLAKTATIVPAHTVTQGTTNSAAEPVKQVTG